MDIIFKIPYGEIVDLVVKEVSLIRGFTDGSQRASIQVSDCYGYDPGSTYRMFAHFVVSFHADTHPAFYFDRGRICETVLQYIRTTYSMTEQYTFGYSYVMVPSPQPGRISGDMVLGYLTLEAKNISQ